MEPDWTFRGIVFGILAVVALVVVVSIRHDRRQITECQATGKQWVETGSHITTTYVQSGSVLLPIESRTKEYGCR